MNALTHYEQLYQSHQHKFTGYNLSWLRKQREVALQNFISNGFPTHKTEYWKYTPTDTLASFEAQLALAQKMTVSEQYEQYLNAQLLDLIDEDYDYLIFVNGFFWKKKIISPEMSQPQVFVSSMADRINNPDSADSSNLETLLNRLTTTTAPGYFTDLNTCFWQDGAYIHVAANTHATTPLHIVYITTADAASHHLGLRNVISLDASSSLTLLQSHMHLGDSPAPYFHHHVNEIFLSQHAKLQHYQFTEHAKDSYHFGHSNVLQHAHSDYQHFTLALTGHWQRHQLQCHLHEPYAHAHLNGLVIANEQQLIHQQATIHHRAMHCSSHESFWGVADNAAKAIFNAKTIVALGADHTSSSQQNKNLLLSNQAEIDTQPELEIYAKDVQCNHGATVGQLNADALFYMNARGIPDDVAKHLLLEGFSSQFTNRLPELTLQQLAQLKISNKLDAMMATHKDKHDVI